MMGTGKMKLKIYVSGSGKEVKIMDFGEAHDKIHAYLKKKKKDHCIWELSGEAKLKTNTYCEFD